MKTHVKNSDSTHQPWNDLLKINGVGPHWAALLHDIGVDLCAELAQYTPENLARALADKPGVKTAENWISQAQSLNETETTVSDEQMPIEAALQDLPDATADWNAVAEFTVFFDTLSTDSPQEEDWHVRVYHAESGEEVVMPSCDTEAWVEWIEQRVELPGRNRTLADDSRAVAETSASKDSETATSEMEAPYNAQVEVTNIRLAESPVNALENCIKTEVCFNVSGSDVERLTTDRVPYRVEVYAVDLDDGASTLLASKQDQLHPHIVEYKDQLRSPMLHMGQYELHSLVTLLAPADTFARHCGPVISIVP